MSSFNKPLNDRNQFIIGIKVIKCPSIEQYKDGTAQKLIINAKPKRALIDTGAFISCITQDLADELELIPIGREIMGTAGDPCYVFQYKVDFAIPVETPVLQPATPKENEMESMRGIIINEEHWAHVQQKINSVPAINKDRGFDFILGIDILSKMHITIFGGQIIMSF